MLFKSWNLLAISHTSWLFLYMINIVTPHTENFDSDTQGIYNIFILNLISIITHA